MQQQAYETGSGAIAYSLTASKTEQVTEVRLHLSAAGGAAENITITHNSALGSEYDVNLLTQDMTTIQDLIWKPDGNFHELANGDSLDIAYTNSNARDYGLEILYR